MYDAEVLCEKIRKIFPDIGKCGIDVKVTYDEALKSWVVDLSRKNRRLRTYLEPEEADQCVEGKQCVSLGIQIAQLKDNIQKL
jgi:hypothetical protein